MNTKLKGKRAVPEENRIKSPELTLTRSARNGEVQDMAKRIQPDAKLTPEELVKKIVDAKRKKDDDSIMNLRMRRHFREAKGRGRNIT